MGKSHWFKLILVAAMLMLANRSHALYTNYLDVVQATLAGQYNFLTNIASPTRAEKQQIVLIGRALKTLAKPSTSVAGDYALFVTAATQLGPIGRDPQFLTLGTNVFRAFTNEAQVEIVATGDRIAALSPFNATRKAASNQLAKARRTLNSISSLTDIRLALVVGRQVFTKIVAANRLAAIAEEHPIYAPPSVIGRTLHHEGNGNSGMVHFDSATSATDTDSGDVPRTSKYSYKRTSPTTATLTLREQHDAGTSTTTVRLTFTSVNGGTFTFHHVDADGTTEDGDGTFTLN